MGSEVGFISNLLSGLLGALLGAAAAIWAQRRENAKARAIELIRELERKLGVVRATPTDPLQGEILQFYREQGGSLSPAAGAYLDYLTDLEFLLFAADRNFIKLDDVRFWLRDHLRPDSDLRTFIASLRTVTGSTATFEFLLQWHSKERANFPQKTRT